MSALLDNPEIIQPPSRGHNSASLPLVLIHDGGGTCFAYNCLSPLSRPLYGIHNPRFWTGQAWEGGIPQMAALYADMIRRLVRASNFPSPTSAGTTLGDGSGNGTRSRAKRIILGGWSLGGLLSLQIAHVLHLDPSQDVIIEGIVLIDSVYPSQALDGLPAHSVLESLGPKATRSQVLSRACLRLAPEMMKTWDVPRWDAIPRAVLIRAEEMIRPSCTHPPLGKTGDGGQEEKDEGDRPGKTLVDFWREDRELGWGEYKSGWIEEVFEVKGNHFSMFSFEHIDGITDAIEKACQVLQRG